MYKENDIVVCISPGPNRTLTKDKQYKVVDILGTDPLMVSIINDEGSQCEYHYARFALAEIPVEVEVIY